MISLIEIQDRIKEYVKGQDDIVNKLCIFVYKHFFKLLLETDYGYKFNKPSVVLLCGHSGNGKTFLIKTLSEILVKERSDFQYIELNATTIVPEGYTGLSLNKQINLYHKSRTGIIFIDEFDKLLLSSDTTDSGDYNKNRQVSLLKYIEGYPGEDAKFETKRFIFVLGGAFNSVYETLNKQQIGFSKEEKEQTLTVDLFIKNGMFPEIAGRIQEYFFLNPLQAEMYTEILNTENFILNQYKFLLEKFDIPLELDYDKIVKEAVNIKLGARGLIQIVEREVTNIIDQYKYKMDFEKLSPLYVRK